MAKKLVVEKPPIELPYNWRDASQYDYTKEHTNYQWAWEFLRRNPDYQNDWLEVSDCFKRDNPKAKSPQIIESTIVHEKWHLHQFVNPTAINLGFKVLTQHLAFFPIKGTLYYGSDDISLLKDSLKVKVDHFNLKHHAMGIFDLGAELEPQLVAIKKLLQQSQKKYQKQFGKSVSKTQKGKYKNYIRILDAIQQGSRSVEIIAALYDRTKSDEARRNFYNDRETAVKFMHKKYRMIAEKL